MRIVDNETKLPGFRFTRWHTRDWRFIGFMVLSLVAIGFYLAASLTRLEQSGSSWRRIDIEAVQRLMDSGELSGREAEWFHSTRPEERSGGSISR